MTLPEEVRAHAAQVMAGARLVRIDAERAAAVGADGDAMTPALDPEAHFLEGDRDAVAAYLLTLDAINFGSGWFPELRKRRGRSGYFTIASRLTDRFRAHGPWTAAQLRALRTDEIASVLGQPRDHELMSLFAQALRQLGGFLGDRTPVQLVDAAGGSAVRLARTVAGAMSMWADRGFYKRAQILPSDLALAGVAEFADLDALTIFADNLVPHVLRCDGVLVYDPALAAHIDAERVLTDTVAEREIRAAAVHACAQIAARLDVPERVLDMWLWNRGQAPGYKARPRHRARTVFY
jgi:Potential Queuosine, Q, salvage protein family